MFFMMLNLNLMTLPFRAGSKMARGVFWEERGKGKGGRKRREEKEKKIEDLKLTI